MTYLEAVIKESMRLYPPVSYMSRKLDSDLHLGNILWPSKLGLNLYHIEQATKERICLQAIETIKNVGPKNARVEQPVLESLSETISLLSKDCFLVTCYNCDKLETVSKWKCSFKSLWNLCSKNKLINTLWPSLSQYLVWGYFTSSNDESLLT